jgi:Cu-Zn family superoxide dismutase
LLGNRNTERKEVLMNIQTKPATIAIGCLLALIPLACSPGEISQAPLPEIPLETGPDITEAVAVLHPTEGNEAAGTVTFTKTEMGIRIVADISGLAPGKHGFHIHEFGDCRAVDATSAGGHYNPEDMPHGAPTDAQRHVGDLGNLIADDTGHAHYERTDDLMTFSGENSIIGRGVIVHSGEDDLETQPTGNSGSRVACGVIGVAKEAES